MIKTILVAVLITLVMIVAAVMNYLGAFKDVDIELKEREALYLAYRLHRGPYHQIMETLSAVEQEMRDAGRPCALTFGRYLDNPEVSDEDRLRAEVGCVLPDPPQGLLTGIEFQTLEPGLYLEAKFSGAPSIGPYKVYPRAEEWMNKKGYRATGPVIEIYEVQGPRVETTYLFPVTR